MKACGRARPSARPCRPPGCSEEAPRGVGPRSGFGEARWEPAPRRWAACLGAGRRLETWRWASSRVRDPGASPTTTHSDTFNAACHRSEHPRRGDRPPPDRQDLRDFEARVADGVGVCDQHGFRIQRAPRVQDDHGDVAWTMGIGAGHPRRPEQHCGIVRAALFPPRLVRRVDHRPDGSHTLPSSGRACGIHPARWLSRLQRPR